MMSDVRLGFRFFFFQAEDGIRDLVRSRGLGDVYKRQGQISFALDEYPVTLRPEGKDANTSVNAMYNGLMYELSLIHI